MLPAPGRRLPVSICMVVVLPAPFGPRKPSTSPRPTLISTSRTTGRPAKLRDSARASRVSGEAGSDIDERGSIGDGDCPAAGVN